jgi:enoyl-CoA hydratase
VAYETLRIEDRGPVRIVTIDRPKVLNALDAQVVDELTRAVESIATEGSVRGLVLTGGGEKAFVAGADIAAMANMTPAEALAFAGRGHALGDRLTALPIPTVAAVNGFALGGGCELALACDFIYASRKARFGQPEVKLGVVPGFGGTQRLARRVGVSKAKELIFTGDMIDAQAALRIGLVDAVFEPEELMGKVTEVAARIAANGPLAVAEAKKLIHLGQSMSLESAIILEQRGFAGLFATEDQKEGMAAFVDKRAAGFRGA